jgi:ABC-type Fe3+-hydroxamate transport system substrate-binding protein
MRVFTDQVGRQVTLPDAPPRRIVSLVPSQTELLADLGLDEEVVGITKFCIHPNQWFKSKKRIGGTKDVKIEEVLALQPDLIIANKEENEQGTLEILSQFAPVWISDVRHLSQARSMIAEVGAMVGKSETAQILLAEIEQGFKNVQPFLQGKKVLYLIWHKPWMSAGPDTFIGSILQDHLGANLCIPPQDGRYPVVEEVDFMALKPEVVLLSSEPFPFKNKHTAQIQSYLPQAQVVKVEGDMFSWYGSRLRSTPTYLQQFANSLRA